MNEAYTLSLALFDFVPNLAFLVGAFYLVKLALLIKGRPCGRMLMAGTLLIFAGGFLKATWKLLYTTGIADLRLMGEIQFVLLAPGFLALLVAAVLLARSQRMKSSLPLLVIAAWKIPLLIVMTVSSLGAHGVMTYLAFRRGARWAAAGFIVAFLCTLAMGGMASGEQSIQKQWIEEAVNSVGQVGFAVGSLLIYKNFLHKQNLDPETVCA